MTAITALLSVIVSMMACRMLPGRTDRINYHAAKGMLARAVNRLKIKKRYGKYN